MNKFAYLALFLAAAQGKKLSTSIKFDPSKDEKMFEEVESELAQAERNVA